MPASIVTAAAAKAILIASMHSTVPGYEQGFRWEVRPHYNPFALAMPSKQYFAQNNPKIKPGVKK